MKRIRAWADLKFSESLIRDTAKCESSQQYFLKTRSKISSKFFYFTKIQLCLKFRQYYDIIIHCYYYSKLRGIGIVITNASGYEITVCMLIWWLKRFTFESERFIKYYSCSTECNIRGGLTVCGTCEFKKFHSFFLFIAVHKNNRQITLLIRRVMCHFLCDMSIIYL